MSKKKNFWIYLIIGIVLFFGYVFLLGSYPLLDPDETRYVNMAKEMLSSRDFMTLYLNGEYFFEKPPLYFWLECIGFTLLGNVSEWTARLPIVALSILPLALIFDLCRRIKGSRFALISSLVLLTSAEYVLLTKIAILDSVLTSLVASAILFYFYTFFVQEKNKKYFWILTYIFTGLSVLAKGIPGLALPLGVIFISTIVFKTYKETFKYSILGAILVLLITVPWHVLMLKIYPDLFFDEYIYKHHILRFLGSEVIHRNQPWYFYLLTILWGIFPHIFVVLPKIVQNAFSSVKEKAINFKFDLKNNFSKFLLLATVASVVIMLFFSSSKAKLITYILPIYPFLAILIGNMWLNYIKNDNKIVTKSLLIMNGILTFVGIVAPIVLIFLPKAIKSLFVPLLLLAPVVILPFTFFIIKLLKKNKRFKAFLLQIIFISVMIGVLTPFGFNVDYYFGQSDLMKFAQMAKENQNTISTYLVGRKYCLLYYSGLKKIDFKTDEDMEWLKNELKKENNFVIMRNKKIKDLPVKIKEKGVKYSIIEGILDERE